MISSFIPIIACSAIGFKCFNSWLNSGYLTPPGKYTGSDNHRWRNAVTSLVHAAVVGCIAVYCLVTQPRLWNDPVTHYAVSVEVCFAVVSGYLIYDTFDLLAHNHFVKVWSLIVHHVIMASTFTIMSVEHLAMGILTIGLLSEFSAIFLHSRQLILMYGCSKRTVLYGVHMAFNFVTFVLLRLPPLVYAAYTSYITHDLPPYLAASLPFMTTAIVIINFVLLWRLICSDLLAKEEKDRHVMDN